jgi:hypothetical protein
MISRAGPVATPGRLLDLALPAPKMYNNGVHKVTMGKRVNVRISVARAKLFQLADLVRSSGEDAVVVLEQRGEPDRIALVREARLAYLEARVSELERRQRQPFKLAGSLASDLDEASLTAALRTIRQEWTPRDVTPLAGQASGKGRRRRR